MRKTLSLNRRAHLYVKDGAFWIKLQRPHNLDPMKADLYILKRFSIEQLKEIRDWADEIIKNTENNNVETN